MKTYKNRPDEVRVTGPFPQYNKYGEARPVWMVCRYGNGEAIGTPYHFFDREAAQSLARNMKPQGIEVRDLSGATLSVPTALPKSWRRPVSQVPAANLELTPEDIPF